MLTGPIAIAAYVYVIGVAVLLIWEDRDPTTTLAWLLLLMFLPVVGIPLYVLFGRNWRRRRESRVAGEIAGASRIVMSSVRETNEAVSFARDVRSVNSDVRKVIASVEEQCDAPPLPADRLEVISSGEEMFARLLEDIAGARDSIHLQYYIWECDELTGRIVEALKERIAAGVEVRLAHDLIGSLRYGKAQLRDLVRAGGRVEADRTNLNMLNYRNHRKIVVIDGKIGYTGGFNVGREYIDGGRRFPSWRDTHLRVTGPFVADLQRLFAARWREKTDESLFASRYFPTFVACDPATALMLQIEHSSIESEWEAIRQSLIIAITNANERVWISSPYFVPDQGVYDALISTALSGVDVRLIMAGLPDKRVPFWAAESYYARFLQAGGRVYQYTAGFYHAKAISFDSTFCTIGTTNLDTRSLSLHDEMTVWIYDADVARIQDRLFEADMANSREITVADVDAYSGPERFRSSLMRLGAKML